MKTQLTIPLYPENSGIKSPDGFIPFMTFYPLAVSKPAGCVLVCPGGGYAMRARHEADPIAKRFNALGFHAAVVEYRVAPAVYPAPQCDAIRAIKILRSLCTEYKISSDHIAILGFSAGGHLAASTGILHDTIPAMVNDDIDQLCGRPDASILCYPVISIESEFGHVGSGDNLLGTTGDSAARSELSLHKWVTPDTPPAFLWHTAEDAGVPCRNSIEYAKALWANKVKASLHIFPQGEHGLGEALQTPCAGVWVDLAAGFLKESLGFPTE